MSPTVLWVLRRGTGRVIQRSLTRPRAAAPCTMRRRPGGISGSATPAGRVEVATSTARSELLRVETSSACCEPRLEIVGLRRRAGVPLGRGALEEAQRLVEVLHRAAAVA